MGIHSNCSQIVKKSKEKASFLDLKW